MEQYVRNEYQKWLSETSLLKCDHDSLEAMKGNDDLINDAFYQNLAFGTGGLRGELGVGTNRMNIYVVRKATQGIANYLNKYFKNPSVVISRDSRNFSKEFAYEAAKVLSSNGIRAYIYEAIKPTPVCSYSVRKLGCQAGIMITASHNPKKYNGYKVYGEDGGQITDTLAGIVSDEINALDIFKDIKCDDDSLVSPVPQSVYEDYLASTMKKSLLEKSVSRDINIIYTPLNGTGRYPIQDILKLDGFKNVTVVKEQEEPDGNFTTCPYPNPEFHEALELGVKLLKEKNADILMATDPDCDRVGLVSYDKAGIHYYTGNEVGIFLFDYIYRCLKETGKLPANPAVVKTIVTTDLINVMAKKLGMEVYEVLTGFKYIGEVISNLEKVGRKNDYLLGFEESCGYLTNTDVRDKDGVNACMLVAEATAFWKSKGLSPYQRIEQIYDEYGHYSTDLVNYEFPGQEGKEKIARIVDCFRNNDVRFPTGKVQTKNDYKLSISKTGDKTSEIKLPKSNVIKYIFEDGTTVTIRPSGTEPKVKIYFCSKSKEDIATLKAFLDTIVKKY